MWGKDSYKKHSNNNNDDNNNNVKNSEYSDNNQPH